MTDAKQVLLVEEETGTILFEKQSAAAFSSASLSKLMTAEVVLDALKNGRLRLEDEFPVSENAWRTGGAPSRTATMFAAVRSRVPVSALLRGLMVQMANDACLILAEGMAGSEENFVKRMNERAAALGLKDSHFANATGLPDPGNKVSARDMLKLAEHVRQAYPEFYSLYKQPDFEWNRIFQRNRNPLLGQAPGVDGLVAGFAEGEGYSVVASAEQNGTRLFLVMAGSETEKARVDDAARAFAWGFSSFEKIRLFEAGQEVEKATVYGGEPKQVALVAEQPVDVYAPLGSADKLEADVTYAWPLRPGFGKGDEIARLQIRLGDKVLRQEPLHAADASALAPLTARARDALVELLFFWL
ncbi:D-alanyl-D-alanine carboxypeptidase family protein [Rhizobium paknamense]|uniref:serine-type D-Ala-D-Ala carboxypeptidase n=1 Tax=Rhizobium paknamense TaxID=1206817 RepID=A0ABU0I805_9HYPH|nr:D-alanyl-D-alanine carboxypeptidase family protein [Rhizobium paknamense]MDQ0453758.1 D-alanyl-D-alanine carboxypeptidase (penicillin-binding protein 5/6) [Rhizobium paknamense]